MSPQGCAHGYVPPPLREGATQPYGCISCALEALEQGQRRLVERCEELRDWVSEDSERIRCTWDLVQGMPGALTGLRQGQGQLEQEAAQAVAEVRTLHRWAQQVAQRVESQVEGLQHRVRAVEVGKGWRGYVADWLSLLALRVRMGAPERFG